MKKIVSLIFLFLIPLIFASNQQDPYSITVREMFTPAADNISINILRQMFGGAGNMIYALSGPVNDVIKNIFLYLNVGVLFIASILLTYTITTGVLRTSQDGGMSQMGKISPMTIFRIVTGLTLMGPIPGVGFSTIQVGVLWATVHGIGFADTIFSYVAKNFTNNTVSSIQSQAPDYSIEVVTQRKSLKNNSAYKKNQFISDDQDNIYQYGDKFNYSLLDNIGFISKKTEDYVAINNKNLKQDVSDFITNPGIQANGPVADSKVNYSEIMAAAMCLAVIDNAYKGPDSNCTKDCDKGFAVRTQGCSDDGSINLCFGYNNNPSLCGGYKVNGYNLNSIFTNSSYNFEVFKPFIIRYKQAMLDNYAKYLNLKSTGAKEEALEKFIKDKKLENTLCNGDCEISKSLSELATYQVSSAKKSDGGAKSINSIKNDSDDSRKGWLAAGYNIDQLSAGFKNKSEYVMPERSVLDLFVGSIYLRMLDISAKGLSKDFQVNSSFFTQTSISLPQKEIMKLFGIFVSSILGVDPLVVSLPECYTPTMKGCLKSAVKNRYIIMPEDNSSNSNSVLVKSGFRSGILGSIVSFSKDPFAYNPISEVRNTGIVLLSVIYNLWKQFPKDLLQNSALILKKYKSLMITIGSISIGIQAGLEMIPPAAGPIGHMMAVSLAVITDAFLIVPQLFYQYDITRLMMYVPILTAFTVAIFGVAFILAVWIPIIPMLMFCLAVIGWLISLVEAMVAAPLVAVGITHPEGHDFLGQAQQSLMLLLIVFLKPVLILFGLLTSVVIFYLIAYLVNIGFVSSLFNILSSDIFLSNRIYFAVMLVCFLMLYAYIMSSAVSMAFSNIFRVPERIVLWIGGQPEQSPISQIMDKTKAQSTQSVSQAGMGAGTSSSDVADRGKAASLGGKGAEAPGKKQSSSKDHKASS